MKIKISKLGLAMRGTLINNILYLAVFLVRLHHENSYFAKYGSWLKCTEPEKNVKGCESEPKRQTGKLVE